VQIMEKKKKKAPLGEEEFDSLTEDTSMENFDSPNRTGVAQHEIPRQKVEQ